MWWVIFVRSWLDLIASIQFLVKGERAHSAAIHRAHADFFFRIHKWHQLRKHTQQLRKKGAVLQGVYSFSIVFRYYILKQKTFDQL